MERCSFFNAELNGETYDRVYLAEDFARYFSSFIGNGVFPNPATGLQVVADNKTMNVIVKPGKAWINGYFYENTDDLTLQVNVADGVLNRIDKVVLRLDFLNREIKTYVKQGNFASTPISPALTRNADIYELALAEIKINKGIIKIDQAAISDLRFNKELCGVVKGTIEEIDTTDLFVKFENGFNAWFEHMKGTIEGDAAANLTNKVYELNSKLNTKADATQIDDLNSKLNAKATKDGTLQAKLNAERVGGKLASELALKSELNDTKNDINNAINNTNNEIKKINNSKGTASGIATLDNKSKVPAIQLNKGIDNLVSTSNSGKTTLINLDIKKYNYIEIYIRCGGASASSVLVNDEELSMRATSYMLQISSNGQIFGQNQASNNGDDYFSHMRYIKTINLKENNTLTLDTKNYVGYKNVKGYY